MQNSLRSRHQRSWRCQGYRNYLCANGTCVNHYAQCKSPHEYCVQHRSYWCEDIKMCVEDDERCLRPCGFWQSEYSVRYLTHCEGYPRKCAKANYPEDCPKNCPYPLKNCPQDGHCVRDVKLCKPCYSFFDRRCVSNAKCYSQSQWCDGHADCFDSSDEMDCEKSSNVIRPWVVGVTIMSVLLVLFIISVILTYRQKQYNRQRRGASNRLVARVLGNQLLVTRDNRSSRSDDQRRGMTISVEPPPPTNLRNGHSTRQSIPMASSPTHIQMNFGSRQLRSSSTPNTAHGSYHSINVPPSTPISAGSRERVDGVLEPMTWMSQPAEPSENPLAAPPPSYFEVVGSEDRYPTTTPRDDGLPTYEESIKGSQLESRL